MTAPDPWQASDAGMTPEEAFYARDLWAEKEPADPDVRMGPTIYADDPQSVVDFLTGDYPYHLTHDAAWADDDDDDC